MAVELRKMTVSLPLLLSLRSVGYYVDELDHSTLKLEIDFGAQNHC